MDLQAKHFEDSIKFSSMSKKYRTFLKESFFNESKYRNLSLSVHFGKSFQPRGVCVWQMVCFDPQFSCQINVLKFRMNIFSHDCWEKTKAAFQFNDGEWIDAFRKFKKNSNCLKSFWKWLISEHKMHLVVNLQDRHCPKNALTYHYLCQYTHTLTHWMEKAKVLWRWMDFGIAIWYMLICYLVL